MSNSIYPADAFLMRSRIRKIGRHYPTSLVRQAERVAINKMRETNSATGALSGQMFLQRVVRAPRPTPPSAA